MAADATNLEDLRRVARLAVDEVVEDAIKLLELYHRLKRTPADTDAYRDLEIELETQITALRVHAQSAEEIFDGILDALPDDEDEAQAL